MSKKNEILNLLCEEFDSKWNPYVFLEISAKFAEIGNNNTSIMQHLDDETKKNIKNNLDKISRLGEMNAEIINRIEQHKPLIERKENLETDNNKLTEQVNEIERLQNIEKKISDTKTGLEANQKLIDSLENSLKQINKNIDSIIADFTKKLTDLQDFLSRNDLGQDIINIISIVECNLKKIRQEEVIQCMEKLSEFENEFENISKEINLKIDNLNNVMKSFNDNGVPEKLNSVREIYKKQIEEDKTILEILVKNCDLNVKEWIQNKMTKLDELLKDIENALGKKITEREKKSIDELFEWKWKWEPETIAD